MKTASIAAFPGTFDPITFGHIDIIRRGAKMFDKLVVGVSMRSGKQTMFTVAERADMIKILLSDLDNVSVESFDGMTVDWVQRLGARAILRGLRTFADFEYEFQLALANRRMANVETVFVMASAEISFIRSTMIKEVAALGGDIRSFVPPLVAAAVGRKLPHPLRQSTGMSGDETPQLGRKGTGLEGEGLE